MSSDPITAERPSPRSTPTTAHPLARRSRLRQPARRDLGRPHRRGERVREEEIARSLGVSRTPVREALQRLQRRGLLVTGLGRGLIVAELSKREVIELYAMREILEGSAARFAAQRATRPEIDILYRLQRDLAEAPDDALLLVKLNRRFHQAISDAAHNQYLTGRSTPLHDSMALLHSTTSARQPAPRIGRGASADRLGDRARTPPTRPRRSPASTSARRSARASRR